MSDKSDEDIRIVKNRNNRHGHFCNMLLHTSFGCLIWNSRAGIAGWLSSLRAHTIAFIFFSSYYFRWHKKG